jgi:hypothetical protein
VVFAAGKPFLLVPSPRRMAAPVGPAPLPGFERRGRRGPAAPNPPAEPQEPQPVFNPATGEKLGTFAGEAPVNRSTRLSPDGRLLATYDMFGPQGAIDVWELGSKQAAARLQPGEAVCWFDFTPEGRRLVVCCWGQRAQRLQMWDVPGGKKTTDEPLPAQFFPVPENGNPPPVPHVGTMSPGGRYVALQSGRRLVVLTLADAKPVGDLWFEALDVSQMYFQRPRRGWPQSKVSNFPREGYWQVRSLQFSPDGGELRALFLHVSSQHMAGRLNTRVEGSRVCCWRMKDGALGTNVELATPAVEGPVLTGPDADSLIVSGNYEWAYQFFRENRVDPEAAGLVVDRATGVVLSTLPYSPTAVLPDGRLTGFAPNPMSAFNPVSGYTVDLSARRSAVCAKLDRAAFAAAAESIRRAVHFAEARPGDRSAVTVVTPQRPVAWSVPAPAAAAPAELSGLTVRTPEPAAGDDTARMSDFQRRVLQARGERQLPGHQILFAGGRAAVLWTTGSRKPKPRVILSVSHLDLRKGQAGEPLILSSTPTEMRPDALMGQVFAPETLAPSPAAALSPDGRIAVRDARDGGRVDAWDADGKRLAALRPYQQGPVTWLGWGADGKLLTLGEGKLTGWDAAAGKAIFETHGGYSGPVATAPAHVWVALAALGHIDLLDTATGAVRGRLDVPCKVQALAVSADGRRLAALALAPRGAGLTRDVGEPNPGEPVPQGGWRQVWGWDVKDGSGIGFANLRPDDTSCLQWVGPRRLLVGHASVADLDAGCSTAYWPAPGGCSVLPQSPDDRLWLLSFGKDPAPARPQPGAAPATGPGSLVLTALDPPAPPPGRELVFGPKVPVRLEVHCADHSDLVSAHLDVVMREMGQVVGKGGWTLKLSGMLREGPQTVSVLWGARQVLLPAVEGRLQLLAPDGTVVSDRPVSVAFPGRGSRYFVRHTTISATPQRTEWVDEYDFRGQGPRTAMVDEVWDLFAIAGRFYGQGVVKIDGKYVPLPLREDLPQEK